MSPIAFTLPIRLVTESNSNGHWRTKHRRGKAQRHTAYIATLAHLVKATKSPAVQSLLPCRITVTRIGPRRLDTDNAWSSAKHVIDGIADAFNLPDNDPRFQWEVVQERGKPREYAVRISIAKGAA